MGCNCLDSRRDIIEFRMRGIEVMAFNICGFKWKKLMTKMFHLFGFKTGEHMDILEFRVRKVIFLWVQLSGKQYMSLNSNWGNPTFWKSNWKTSTMCEFDGGGGDSMD